MFLDDHLQFSTGDFDDVYHNLLATYPCVLHGEPQRALILGGGDGLALRNMLKFPTMKEVTLVDIDRDVVDLSSHHPVMRGLNQDSLVNPRSNVVIDDATQFIKRVPDGYFDIAVCDFPDPLVPGLQKLYSYDLYRDIRRTLKPNRAVLGTHLAVGETVEKGVMASFNRLFPKVVRRARIVPSLNGLMDFAYGTAGCVAGKKSLF
jgi:spermidine synthase